MDFQDIANLVFGGDMEVFGGVTEEEFKGDFSAQEIQDAGAFLDEYETQLQRWGGIPFAGDISEYDAITHPGKVVLEKMIENWD